MNKACNFKNMKFSAVLSNVSISRLVDNRRDIIRVKINLDKYFVEARSMYYWSFFF